MRDTRAKKHGWVAALALGLVVAATTGSAAGGEEADFTKRRVVYTLPGMDRVRVIQTTLDFLERALALPQP
jgi:hypothetical protein